MSPRRGLNIGAAIQQICRSSGAGCKATGRYSDTREKGKIPNGPQNTPNHAEIRVKCPDPFLRHSAYSAGKIVLSRREMLANRLPSHYTKPCPWSSKMIFFEQKTEASAESNGSCRNIRNQANLGKVNQM